MGDIEKFFNDNFFHKVSSPTTLAQERDMQVKEFLHGVPESAYEPTVQKEEPTVKVEQTEPKESTAHKKVVDYSKVQF